MMQILKAPGNFASKTLRQFVLPPGEFTPNDVFTFILDAIILPCPLCKHTISVKNLHIWIINNTLVLLSIFTDTFFNMIIETILFWIHDFLICNSVSIHSDLVLLIHSDHCPAASLIRTSNTTMLPQWEWYACDIEKMVEKMVTLQLKSSAHMRRIASLTLTSSKILSYSDHVSGIPQACSLSVTEVNGWPPLTMSPTALIFRSAPETLSNVPTINASLSFIYTALIPFISLSHRGNSVLICVMEKCLAPLCHWLILD